MISKEDLLVQESPDYPPEQPAISLQHWLSAVYSSIINSKMTDTQSCATETSSVTHDHQLNLTDLPPEVRLMVYRHAMRGTPGFFPSLLSVSRQIRQEASSVFYSSKRFTVTPQPQPHTKMTELAFDRTTREWFEIIGAEHVSTLRYVTFQFSMRYPSPAQFYHIDLLSCDASKWRFLDTRGQRQSLRKELKRFLKLRFLGCIKKRKAAIRRAQDALDQFTHTCTEGKRIKPTIDGLGIIGAALVRVEEARLGLRRQ
jgi:hypothetical protein